MITDSNGKKIELGKKNKNKNIKNDHSFLFEEIIKAKNIADLKQVLTKIVEAI